MDVVSPSVGREAGLSVEQIETHLIEAASRHHLEERNIAYWLLEIDRRRLFNTRGFSSLGDYAMELVGIKPRKAYYLVFHRQPSRGPPGDQRGFRHREVELDESTGDRCGRDSGNGRGVAREGPTALES